MTYINNVSEEISRKQSRENRSRKSSDYVLQHLISEDGDSDTNHMQLQRTSGDSKSTLILSSKFINSTSKSMNDTQFKDNYLQNSFNIEKKKNSNELNYAINLSSKEIKENIGLTENNKLNLIKLDIGNTNKDDVKENN